MSSILSRVVQLQVAPRGLREANAVKVKSGKMKVESESEQLRQHEQHLVTRSAAASCTAWVARSECCQSGKLKESNLDSMSSILSRVVQLQTKNSPPESGGVPQGRGSVLCG